MEESIITLEEQDPELHNLLSEFVEKNRKKKRFSYISGVMCERFAGKLYRRRREPVKVAKPNEPCPCGSGKKYKKCCG